MPYSMDEIMDKSAYEKCNDPILHINGCRCKVESKIETKSAKIIDCARGRVIVTLLKSKRESHDGFEVCIEFHQPECSFMIISKDEASAIALAIQSLSK